MPLITGISINDDLAGGGAIGVTVPSFHRRLKLRNWIGARRCSILRPLIQNLYQVTYHQGTINAVEI
jgi:hypothetical protein